MSADDQDPLSMAVEFAHSVWARCFGSASVAELCERYAESLQQLQARGPADLSAACVRVRENIEREHRNRYGSFALAAELADERERDAAVHDDAALVAYEAKWRQKLRKLQRAQAGRWRVFGLSEEEVRDTLTLRLIELVRGEGALRAQYQRPGREWGLVCAQQHLRLLRKSFRLRVTVGDVAEEPRFGRARNQEEQCLEVEAERARTLAAQRAERSLGRAQRQWLAALKCSVQAGAIFQASERPNLSAASRLLGKDRSSAQRAYRELQGRFGRELRRIYE